MGRKYASIHVCGDDQEKILIALENNNSNDLENRIWEMARKKYHDNLPESFQKLLKYKDLNKILIIKSEAFISIYDESSSFETIQDKAKGLSIKIDYPILYTSNFDDGVFLIGAYKSGKLITSGRMGVELTEYGMKPKLLNLDKLCNLIPFERTKALSTMNTMEEIDEIEQVIEEHLHIPLDMDINLVQSSEKYVEVLSNNKFNVFSKI